jgi:MFS family permease
MFVSATGGGLVQPFLIVYLTQYRHIAVASATAALSLIAAGSIVGALTSGFAVDRVSLRRVGLVYLTIVSAGTAGFAAADSTWSALATSAVYGFGLGGGGTVLNAAVAESAPEGRSTSALFGAKVAAVNAGVGIGVLLGALLVDVFGSGVFPAMYLADGASSLTVVGAFAVVVTATRRGSRSGAQGNAAKEAKAAPRTAGARRTGPLLLVTLATAGVLFAVGYGQIQSTVPVIATSAHVTSSMLAVTFFVNSVFIVVCQAAFASWMDSTAPGRVLAWGALSWVAVWAVFFPLVVSRSFVTSTALLTVAMTTFAVGEVLIGGALPAIVNNLADDTNRGRYNGGLSLATQTGQVVGPLAGGALLAGGRAGLLVALLAAGCLLSALAGWRMQRADSTIRRWETHVPELAK